MSVRSKYTPISAAPQAEGGNNNLGIVVVRHNRTGRTLVEKRAHPSAVDRGDLLQEILVMLRCNNCTNIVSCREYELDYSRTGYASVYMQHAELGSLDALIGRYAARGIGLADEGFVWKVLWDCSVGLAHLQTGQDTETIRTKGQRGEPIPAKRGWNPIVHRDLKPSNIFMTWANRIGSYPTLLLGDFGCAVTGDDLRAGLGAPGTVPPVDTAWVPPEYPVFSDRSDIFTLGLIVMCLAARTQEPPRGPNPLIGYASQGIITVVENCMERIPRERPSAQELPALVWWGYQEWLKGRDDYGQYLPAWATGR